MKDEIRHLPYAGRRYMVNIFGDVFDKEGVLLEPSKCVEGRSHYELEWVLGKGTYEIGLILLVSFGKLGIDGHLWPEVVVDYKDGDPKIPTS